MVQLIMTDLIYLFFSLWLNAGAGGANQEMACTECHSDMMQQPVMHYPAEDACDNCHESTGASHPGDSIGFTLMDQSPALCFYCHEESTGLEHPHLPVEQGNCLGCHDAHGSQEGALLKYAEKDLCLSCHNKSYESDTSRTVNIRRLVSGKMHAHSAIEGGGCISCHLAHGSENRKLLVDSYPEDDYLPVSIEAFGLCFLCHDTDLLVAEETGWGTNFRNGSQNLHWLHINGNKGRNCRMCHNLHGSEQKFLIEEKVAFGDWEMDMNYIPLEQGGSCLPGCHGELSYSRQ